MEGLEISSEDFYLQPLGKQALVINTPKIDGEQTLITIAFFKESIPKDWNKINYLERI